MAYIEQKEDILICDVQDIVVYYGKDSEITTIADKHNHEMALLNPEEAIAAARAILKHFGEE